MSTELVQRNELGQILPGQGSLNAGGRPKQKIWRDAIMGALNTNPAGEPPNALKIQAIAEALIIAAKAGDIQAVREFGDRIDGKVPQGIVGKDEDSPIEISHTKSDLQILAQFFITNNSEESKSLTELMETADHALNHDHADDAGSQSTAAQIEQKRITE